MPSAAFASALPSVADARRFNRMVSTSFAVHVAVVLFVAFAPRDWFTKRRTPEHLMTITLGGTLGPKTTGTTSIGGRAVEQVAPPPKRETPIKPTPKVEVPPAPVPPKARPPVERNAPIPDAPLPEARPPVTGRAVTAGNTAVETGAKGLGVGLTSGGGGGGGDINISDFCCPEYLRDLMGQTASHWRKDQPERGTTMLKFTIDRTGHISDISTEQSSGSGLLDRAAKDALLQTQLPPLPAAYTPSTLIIHLQFPYNGTP